MDCSTPGFPDLPYLLELLKFMSSESVMLSHHLILYRSLLLLSSFFASIRVSSSESITHYHLCQMVSKQVSQQTVALGLI